MKDPGPGDNPAGNAAARGSRSGDHGPRDLRRGRLLDLAFLIGVALKAVDGLFEVVFGILLLVLGPAQLMHLAQLLTAEELQEDPDDFVAHLLLRAASTLTPSGARIAAAYLLLHGVVKLVIVVAVIRGSAKVYPWVLVALGVFLVWQVAELVLHPTVGIVVLTVLDAAIIALTWREWREHRSFASAFRSVFPPRRRPAAMLSADGGDTP
ncbi:DUF2127 domain-containing protein [Planctomonas sp. JC2975]|uniref:DUF2127 domain-containing protein n=1 Tax=Planctomonas sp. JC2975 TaxID=2729626 RepID=UPI001473FF67|nr:DUF2127 domain-containing protein [Planctomonas sp. JC2975]NNC12636.1 DUF2127 domain-containing protein [Planctomonas sp. JC2975]